MKGSRTWFARVLCLQSEGVDNRRELEVPRETETGSGNGGYVAFRCANTGRQEWSGRSDVERKGHGGAKGDNTHSLCGVVGVRSGVCNSRSEKLLLDGSLSMRGSEVVCNVKHVGAIDNHFHRSNIQQVQWQCQGVAIRRQSLRIAVALRVLQLAE
jgi:hypothetical protein